MIWGARLPTASQPAAALFRDHLLLGPLCAVSLTHSTSMPCEWTALADFRLKLYPWAANPITCVGKNTVDRNPKRH